MTIAIIYTTIGRQNLVNKDHGDAIYNVLKDEYKLKKYFLPDDLEKLIKDVRQKKIDFVINNSCGVFGGDGTIEAILRLLDIRFLGSSMLTTAVGYDKKFTKRILADAGLAIVKDLVIGQDDWKRHRETVIGRIQRKIGFPLIVKASRGTDSIGVNAVFKKADLTKAVNRAFWEDKRVIIEQFIAKKVEITCMAYGNGNRLRAFDVVEYRHGGDILSAEQKMKHIDIERISPARINQKLFKQAQKMAVTSHRVLGCRDYSRTDMVIDKNNKIYILEVNIHAGLGENSPTSVSAKSTRGWSYQKFIKQLIKTSLRRKNFIKK